MDTQSYINSINLNADKEFPYLVLEVVGDHSYPQNPGFHVMHWHEDIQFIYAAAGAVCVQTLNDEVALSCGDGIFINKNVVHHVKAAGDCHYFSFIFPEYILKFYTGCPANTQIESLIGLEQVPLCRFAKDQDQCARIISILRELVELEKDRSEYYVYEVLIRLSALILLTRKNVVLPPVKRNDAIAVRMKTILTYIETHYETDISLEDLARSANVSKSECLRCFKLSMQTTPYKYLIEYRLSRAAQLLRSTEESVGSISAAVGFHQMSLFGKYFKEKTGCTPREYRKEARQNA